MQNVAWPMAMVMVPNLMPPMSGASRKAELRAMPVAMPGRAMGITTRNETTSRPKNR